MGRLWITGCMVSTFVAGLMVPAPLRADEFSQDDARAALHRAVRFFREEVSAGPGAYLWGYSADLSKREGEGKVSATTGWLQPPGTPAVGMAYLDAWRLTGDPLLRDAAVETAHALVRGQLQSGGWSEGIEFDPAQRRRHAYRVDGRTEGRNETTFDDNKSQSALQFLMQVDQALKFRDPKIHEACRYALKSFLKAQYPNGAWPQQYTRFPDPEKFPVRRASYPESWPREYPRKRYSGYYTLNDNTISDVIETVLMAAEIYEEPQYRAAAEKGGDFLLLAQMPEPQPGWAQQYTPEMHPAWARKFEPPAITGSESQQVIATLMMLARHTGREKYLQPIPRALEYYRSSLRKDGKLARFYELHTNRPLYFTKDYKLTYSDADMPTHYGFIGSSKLDRLAAQYEKLKDADLHEQARKSTLVRKPSPPRLSSSLRRQAKQVADALDERGAWVEDGRLRYQGGDDDTDRIISPRTFAQNILTLSRYIAAKRD